MLVADPWLPTMTRAPAALQALFGAVVDGWSAQWFAGESMALAPFGPNAAHGSRRDTAFAWRATTDGLRVGMTPDTPLVIGARMLDLSTDDRTAADRTLFEAVAEPCLRDLCTRLVKVGEVGTPDAWRPIDRAPDWIAAIGTSLAIGLTAAMFATLVKRTLKPDVQPHLRSGADALAGIAVEVGAAVGRVDLTVADLRALEVGDVVVLDRHLEDAVAIAIDGSAIPRGRVRVVSAEPRPFLEIIDAAA